MVKIRVKEKCPICNEKFTQIYKLGFLCTTHQTTPKKYYLDLFWKGKRIRLFADIYGQALDSYQRASSLASKIETEIENHQFDPSRYISSDLIDYLFDTRIEKWFTSKFKLAEDNKLAESYTSRIRIYIDCYFKPFFKEKDIRDIRTVDIKEFSNQLSGTQKQKLSSKYKRNIIDALENFFNTLVQDEILREKPKFIKEKISKPKTQWCSREIQDKILNTIPSIHTPIFFLLTRQGIRPGEAVALQWRDIDFENGTVLIRRTESNRVIKDQVKGKNETYRLLHPEVLKLIESLPRRFPKNFIFANPNTGRPYRVYVLERIWNEACKTVGVDVNLYEGSRHSVASQAASRGVSLFKIGEVLGHTDIRTTKRYAKMNVSDQIEVFSVTETVTKPSPRKIDTGK
ncbi:MAG: site-specific integrase [Smithellaceae bacterium]